MSDVARSRRDDARTEPHAAVPGRDGSADPLAELARLVGQEDPFRRVFRPAAVPAPVEPPHGGWEELQAGHRDRHGVDEHGYPEHRLAAHEGYAEPGHEGYAEHGHDDGYPEHGHEGYAEPGHDGYAPHSHDAAPDFAGYADPHHPSGPPVHPDEAGIADERFADEAGAAALPDLWAQGEEAAFDRGPAPAGVGADRRSTARRPLAVLAAVLVLTGGGLAASFLAKGQAGARTAASNAAGGAPTIMAAAGPTKVKVEDPGATAPEDQDAALLNKNANLSAGPVKIVSSQEQPADLSQLPKSDLADGARPLPPPSPSPFPEPKKVKTFVVHPDGSVLSGDGAPPAPGPASPDALGAAQPATPKTEARGGTTPRSAPAPAAAPATVASLAADPAPAEPAPAATARQPSAPGVHAAAKPTEVATSGGYGLQLASSPVEADAQAAFARMKKRYPALLGSLTATIHKAETGDKPVYRVRTGGMGQDEAKALCAKLQGAGGTCYVVRN